MVFMLMLAVTGLPLIFHDEIEHLLEDEVVAPVMPAGTPHLSLDSRYLRPQSSDIPLTSFSRRVARITRMW